MPRINRQYYPVRVFAQKQGYEIEELLHAASNGDLILSVYSEGWEFAYGKYVEVDGKHYAALYEKRIINAPVDLGIRAAKEIYLHGKTSSCRDFRSDNPAYKFMEFVPESPRKYKNFSIDDIYITVVNADAFLLKVKIPHQESSGIWN